MIGFPTFCNTCRRESSVSCVVVDVALCVREACVSSGLFGHRVSVLASFLALALALAPPSLHAPKARGPGLFSHMI